MNKVRKFLAWTFIFLLIFIVVSVFLNIRSSMVFLSKETMILPAIRNYNDKELNNMNATFEILKQLPGTSWSKTGSYRYQYQPDDKS